MLKVEALSEVQSNLINRFGGLSTEFSREDNRGGRAKLVYVFDPHVGPCEITEH